jgi:tetratricopeptide (TPR) repeat protein
MKTPILVLVIIASAAIGGLAVYEFLGVKTAPVLVVNNTSTSAAEPVTSEKAAAPMVQPAVPSVVINPQPVATIHPPTDSGTNSAATELRKKVDELLDSHITAERKHELLQELAKAGLLPQAIAEMQQRAQADPNNPEIPTTIGEAQINELRAMRDSGVTDVNQFGILAMQADENFNAALKLDPSNWEAQFVKNASLYYWPADPTRDGQVIQNLSSLIDQQDGMPSQPEFAGTYLMLGNEYQKMGQTAQAQATWQLGLQKFPGNTELQQKINGQ